ncbi:MAG: tetratricopeptide repeat protein, partial [Myxococcota bacterium]
MTLPPSRLCFAAVGLSLALVAGCTPRIRLERSRPAAVQLPIDQPIALQVETDGTAPSATNVMDAVIGVTQGQVLNKWLAVEPVRNELRVQLQNAGYRLVEPAQAQAVVRVRPVRWHYQLEQQKNVMHGSGRLDVKLELLDAKNPAAPPLYSATYWGTGSAKNLGEPEAMLRAAQRVAGVFLRDTRPSRVSAVVDLDDSDPITEPGIELCKSGQFEAAYAAFSDAVARAPQSAPALYNLAVLAEARGEYNEAESLLQRATAISPKPLYYSALERVRGAQQDAQAMQGSP